MSMSFSDRLLLRVSFFFLAFAVSKPQLSAMSYYYFLLLFGFLSNVSESTLKRVRRKEFAPKMLPLKKEKKGKEYTRVEGLKEH